MLNSVFDFWDKIMYINLYPITLSDTGHGFGYLADDLLYPIPCLSIQDPGERPSSMCKFLTSGWSSAGRHCL